MLIPQVWKHANGCSGWHWCKQLRSPDELDQAKDTIIEAIQKEAFPLEFSALANSKTLTQASPLSKLNQTYA